MRAIFFRLVLVGAMSAVAPLAHAQLLSHRDLSYSMAKTIAETAIDSCAAKGYAVSAVVFFTTDGCRIIDIWVLGDVDAVKQQLGVGTTSTFARDLNIANCEGPDYVANDGCRP